MKNLHLENEKLQGEVSKIKLEKGLLKVKKTQHIMTSNCKYWLMNILR